MKKRFLACLLAFVVTFLLSVPALAAVPSVEQEEDGGAVSVVTEEIEETQIFWRTMNGQLQYRVWSLTYGYWKTDWINMV